jgi:hypothetical protein
MDKAASQPEIFNDIQRPMAPSAASERTSDVPIEPSQPVEAAPAADDYLLPPHETLREIAHRLDLARVHSRECHSAVAEARTNFARALAGWNASGPAPQTQAELMKEHIASNQAERAKRYAAGQGVHYPGVGRTAKALAGGNAKNGGGAAYRRGAYTRAEAMKIEMNRAAAERMNGGSASRIKLPSER